LSKKRSRRCKLYMMRNNSDMAVKKERKMIEMREKQIKRAKEA
jgi:hypothetical protein